MKSFMHHVQVNIDTQNIKFYTDLLDFLGWTAIMQTESFAGFHSEENGDVWFVPAQDNDVSSCNKRGLNHVCFGVSSVQEVDAFVDWLVRNAIKTFPETPKYKPGFGPGDGEVYYQVMFESPDRILFEIVYTGKNVRSQMD